MRNSKNPWIGVALKILACACFAVVNGLVRGLTGGAEFPFAEVAILSFAQLAFLQNAVGTAYMVPLSWSTIKAGLKLKHPHIHLIRVLCAVFGLLCWYRSLSLMPIAYAMALSFTGPLLTVLGSRIFLHESLTLYRLMAIGLGLAGSLIITKPFQVLAGETGLPFPAWATAFPLLAAAFWAGSKICSRKLAAAGESSLVMTGALLLFMAPVSGLMALSSWSMPDSTQWLWILIIGLLATGAHIFQAKSFQYAEVTFLTPFGFSRFLLSGLVGYLFFGEFPKSQTLWVGTIVILLSLYCLSLDQRTLNKHQKTRQAL